MDIAYIDACIHCLLLQYLGAIHTIPWCNISFGGPPFLGFYTFDFD